MTSPDVSRELFRAVAALAEEVWILRDRQRVTEAVLARHGLDLREEIDRFEPDADLARQLDAERRAFIAAILRSFGESRSAPSPP
jgi:hypothetical protein